MEKIILKQNYKIKKKSVNKYFTFKMLKKNKDREISQLYIVLNQSNNDIIPNLRNCIVL